MRRPKLGNVLRPLLRSVRHTVDVGPLDGVAPGKGRVFDVGKGHVAVFRTRGDEVFATAARRPDGGEPLVGGRVAARMLLCPDGFTFNLRTGGCVGGARPSLRTYAARVEGGRILVDVED
jgi:nitrite reductase (NADH) small subunit